MNDKQEIPANLIEGLRQSANGEVEYLGSFAQYVMMIGEPSVTFDTEHFRDIDEMDIEASHLAAQRWDED